MTWQVIFMKEGNTTGVKLKQEDVSGCRILWLLPSQGRLSYCLIVKMGLCSPNLLQGRDDDKLIIASVF